MFKNLRFSKLNNLKLKNENIKGIVFDLGYSFTQIKDPKKGLSFNSQGELNMMMGLNDFSAKEVINNLEVKEIEKILKYFGDENDAKIIAKNIVKERKVKIIDTQELVRIIEKSKRKKSYRVHSSTKTFQALRIFVNKEISELINGLINSAKILKKNGILCFVCWTDFNYNQFFSLPMKALSAVTGIQKPRLGRKPGPFSFNNINYLRRILNNSKFKQIDIKAINTILPAQEITLDLDMLTNIGVAASLIREKKVNKKKVKKIRELISNLFYEKIHGKNKNFKAKFFLITAKK